MVRGTTRRGIVSNALIVVFFSAVLTKLRPSQLPCITRSLAQHYSAPAKRRLAREASRDARGAGLVDGPARALLQSTRVRAAATALANLADTGRLKDVASGAIKLLKEGRLLRGPGELDTSELLTIWPNEVGGHEALRGFVRLLSIGTNDATNFVVAKDGDLAGKVEGMLDGRATCLQFRDVGAAWGPLARLKVESGDSAVRGCHLVAWKRKGAYQTRAELLVGGGPGYSARRGDELYLADADRAAYLEIATFDRLALSAPLLREEDFAELDTLMMDPGEELREAMRFVEETKQLSAEQQAARRLSRLASFPIVQQVIFLAERDADWARVLPVLRQLATLAYEAAESRLTAYWASPKRIGPAVSGAQVFVLVGICVVILLLVAAFLAAQSLQDNADYF